LSTRGWLVQSSSVNLRNWKSKSNGDAGNVIRGGKIEAEFCLSKNVKCGKRKGSGETGTLAGRTKQRKELKKNTGRNRSGGGNWDRHIFHVGRRNSDRRASQRRETPKVRTRRLFVEKGKNTITRPKTAWEKLLPMGEDRGRKGKSVREKRPRAKLEKKVGGRFRLVEEQQSNCHGRQQSGGVVGSQA